MNSVFRHDDVSGDLRTDVRSVAGSRRMPEASPGRPWLVIVVEVLVAAAALGGGVGLIWNNAIGMPADWLAGTPFTSWLLPGILLLFVVTVPMATAAVLEWRRSTAAGATSVVAGAAQIGWIAAQLAIMQKYSFLQPLMIGFGLAVVLLAVWAHRRAPLLPESR